MRRKGLFLSIWIAAWLMALSLVPAGKVYKPDMGNCAGFTAADAGLGA